MRITFRLILVAIVVLAVGLWAVDRSNRQRHDETSLSAKEHEAAMLARARQLEAQAKRNLREHRDGHHCLDPKTGALPGIYAYVQARLSDPASFVPVATEITPASPGGQHLLQLTYRAARADGGTFQRSETFVVQNSNCSFER